MSKRTKGKLGQFRDKLNSYQDNKTAFFERLFEALLAGDCSGVEDVNFSTSRCLDVCEKYLMNILRRDFGRYFDINNRKISNEENSYIDMRLSAMLVEKFIESTELYKEYLKSNEVYKGGFCKYKEWDILLSRCSGGLSFQDVEKIFADQRSVEIVDSTGFCFFYYQESFFCIVRSEIGNKNVDLIIAKKFRSSAEIGGDIRYLHFLEELISLGGESEENPGFFYDQYLKAKKINDFSMSFLELMKLFDVEREKLNKSPSFELDKLLNVVSHIVWFIDFLSTVPSYSPMKLFLAFQESNLSYVNRIMNSVSCVEAHEAFNQFCAAVNQGKESPGSGEYDGQRFYDAKKFLKVISKLFVVQYAMVFAKISPPIGLVSLLKIVGYDMFDVTDFFTDAEFVGSMRGAFGAVYKNDSNLVESLENQYLLALETAKQEWKGGSELCHWEMARFLIEKICDPIKETIRQEFDRQYRLEWKRSQLKVNFTDKAKNEIEDLDSELLMKQGLGTMSYKTLKQRLVELSKEFERYCPAGGRKKRK